MGVCLFGVDVCELAVQDKVGTERAERGGNFASEERVSEHRTILSSGSGALLVSTDFTSISPSASCTAWRRWWRRTFALQSSRKPIGSMP